MRSRWSERTPFVSMSNHATFSVALKSVFDDVNSVRIYMVETMGD